MSEKITYAKKYGAICILDALGTKGIWKKKDPESVITNWENFINTIDRSVVKNKDGVDYSLYAFSDTLILTCSGDHPIEKLLHHLSVDVMTLLAYGFPYRIFLRGCISIGDFYESKKMVLGPAIDESAQYYEIANWIGVHLTPSAFSAVDRLISSSKNLLAPYFTMYSVPINNGRPLDTYALALTNPDLKKIFDPNDNDPETPMCEEERTLIDFIHYRLEHLDDVEGSDKWKNTLDYLKFIHGDFSKSK